MQLRHRLLLGSTLTLILIGLVPRAAQAQNWHRSNGYNPAYSFFWHNYMYNYAPAIYFPGGYWYNQITAPYYPGTTYWGYYSPYRGYHWRYYYSYSPGYAYADPYYVAVPDPYPVTSSTRAPSSKTAEKVEAKKPSAVKPDLPPPEPKPPLSAEEIKSQEERDSARQLRLAKKLLAAATEEQAARKDKDAQRLREFAFEHFAEIAQRYPATPAGREAQQLVMEN